MNLAPHRGGGGRGGRGRGGRHNHDNDKIKCVNVTTACKLNFFD